MKFRILSLVFIFKIVCLQAQVFLDANGWTTVTASADTRIIYVSSSAGNDTSNGLNQNYPVRTLTRGYALVREGYPDWMLLQCGDEWYERIPAWGKSGRSANEPMLISSYGSGARPLIKTENESGFSRAGGYNGLLSHILLIGIDFYCYKRDPSSADYDTSIIGSTGCSWVGSGDDVLIEDCRFRFYTLGLAIQRYTGSQLTNIRLRRCIISDNYSTNSHSQGFYASLIDGLIVEECLFDHNGWLIQGTGNNVQAGGAATMFNHNTYFGECRNVIMRGNMFLRASSMGNKMRSDVTDGTIGAIFDNNLYVEGEIGIGIGGNTTQLFRFRNVIIRNNVMLHIGRSNPTSRNFGWYLDVQDNRHCVISNNCFLFQPWYDNTYAVSLSGGSQEDVTIKDNVVYGIRYRGLRVNIADTAYAWTNVHIMDNIIQDTSLGTSVVHHTGNFLNVYYSGNSYFTNASSTFARIDGIGRSYSEWLSLSGETGSSIDSISFTDPDRTVETYYNHLGGDGTFEGFINEAKQQSKSNWRRAYMASAVNDYIREGFNMDRLDTSVITFNLLPKFVLFQNFPNPFNPSTCIRFYVPEECYVKLTIYDILGRQVCILANSILPEGIQTIEWNGRNSAGQRVGSGVYFYQLKTGSNITITQKMILMN